MPTSDGMTSIVFERSSRSRYGSARLYIGESTHPSHVVSPLCCPPFLEHFRAEVAESVSFYKVDFVSPFRKRSIYCRPCITNPTTAIAAHHKRLLAAADGRMHVSAFWRTD